MTIQSAHKKATGLSIEEGVKKAIKKGYKNWHDELNVDGLLEAWSKEYILLDPAYWKALGKAEGWPQDNDTKLIYGEWQEKRWFGRWHRFIDYLAE